MITWAERAKAAISQKGQGGTAKTDETPFSRLLTVSSVPAEAASGLPERLLSVLAVSSPAVLEKHDSSIEMIEDPDRWCCPHSSAMNGAEIDTFLARLARFTDVGLDLDAAEKLADKLLIRDRERDERHSCLECAHLQRGWRCGNWQVAGVAMCQQDAQLPRAVVLQLQRCDGFVHHASAIDAHDDDQEQHGFCEMESDMHDLPGA